MAVVCKYGLMCYNPICPGFNLFHDEKTHSLSPSSGAHAMAKIKSKNMKKHFKEESEAKDIETSKKINIKIINEARMSEFYSELSQMLKYEPEIYGWFWMMAEAKETETKETGTKAK